MINSFKESFSGRSIQELLSTEVEEREWFHPLVPPGFTLLAGAPKAGKSLFAEFIAKEASLEVPVLYLALEYNLPVFKGRFGHFSPDCNITVFLEGDIQRFEHGGKATLELALARSEARIVIIDTVSRLKENAEAKGYEGQTDALNALKLALAEYRVDTIAIHHTRKKGSNEDDDPFERILGSTALAAVPDNLMVLDNEGGFTVVYAKGRLIMPSKQVFEFKDQKFLLKSNEGSSLEYLAPVQAAVIDALAAGSKTVTELTEITERSKSQISRVCNALYRSGRISRKSRNDPYSLIDKGLA